jgi:drug/metabolite transporter (DMT)-like permease
MMTLPLWLLFFTGILLSALGGLTLKVGAVEIQYDAPLAEIAWQLLTNWKVWLGSLCYLIPLLIWIYMLKKVDLSFLQPLFSLVYVVTPVLAVIFLHEQAPMLRWVGIAVIIVGVAIVSQT